MKNVKCLISLEVEGVKYKEKKRLDFSIRICYNMSMRYTPTDITSTYAAIAALNVNFDDIAALLEKCVFVDGTAPNQMEADLDLNHFSAKNVGVPVDQTDAVRLVDLQSAMPTLSGSSLATLATSTGASLVGTTQSGTGATLRTVQSKLRQTIDVEDFGADPTGVADSYAAFQAAIDSLPSGGGKIRAVGGIYKLNTQPSFGTKSLVWEFGPNTVFQGTGTGEGKFPYATTNVALLPVGTFIQSQSSQKSTNSNGGVAALTVEMLQPVGYGAGQSVAFYSAARSANTNAAGNVWAANLLVHADSGAGGNFYGNEIDVDCYSGSATMAGILLSGTGDHNPTAAIITDRLLGKWQTGINIRKAIDGLVIFGESGGRGVVVDAPGNVNLAPYNVALGARQFANNLDTLFLQRFTDTSPTGYFVRFRNAADTTDLYSVDVAGKIFSSTLSLSAATPVVSSGQLGIGTTTSTTATAGANGALPAQVLGYLVLSLGGTNIKVPYYSA